METFIWFSSPLPWIFCLTFFVFFTSPLSAATLSYSDHCALLVPQATPELYSIAPPTLPFYLHSRGYYSGGSPILKGSNSSTFTFQTQAVKKTDLEGIIKVDADLVFMLSESGGYSSGPDTGNIYIPQPGTVIRSSNDRTRRRESVNFRLEGFWSVSSGRLCMVGYGVDEDLKIDAVLKLNNVRTSSSITNLITGTFEGLSSGFDPISMLMFPQKNYSYSLLAPQETVIFPKISDQNGFCSKLDSWYNFRLKYSDDCDSAKNCSPLSSLLLPSMVPYVIGCDFDSTKLRVLLQFSNQSSKSRYNRDSAIFEPKTALVGEGFWDDKENLLHFDACRISVTDSLSDARVEDCSISFNFQFPAVWSIKERNFIVGEIKSKKTPTESGYFGTITARRSSSFWSSHDSDKKYEYSQIDRVRDLCPDNNRSESINTYPNWDSDDLDFDMSVETKRGKKIGEGRCSPLFVGDRFYRRQYRSGKSNDAPIIQGKPGKNNKLMMSYKMTVSRLGEVKFSSGSTIFDGSDADLGDEMVISAEGVYDGSTGSLCMIGCRSLVDSMDCEILIKIQFPPLDYAKNARDSIKGSIESLRKRSDPLYFDTVKISTTSFYERSSARSIWKLDSKLTLVVVSSTLSCVFAALQVLHVKKHPHVVPLASQLMLIVLILGHTIPLILNFHGSFQDNRFNRFRYSDEKERWVQTGEVLVRVATLLALKFEFFLLQQSFSATRRNNKPLVAEKKALFLTLPLYALLALAAVFINSSLWNASKCFAELVHTGFLLPQILVNIVRNSKGKILSVPFYIGTTLIHVMPYGYYVSISDLSNGSNRIGTVRVVIIPLGSLLFAGVVYLQQRFGGRCFVPWRFGIDSVADEKVTLIRDS